MLSEREKGRARDKAAEMLGINPHYNLTPKKSNRMLPKSET
jgi:hypothetical protein